MSKESKGNLTIQKANLKMNTIELFEEQKKLESKEKNWDLEKRMETVQTCKGLLSCSVA